MNRIVLVRHGESAWNRENRFTGWTDVDLSETGMAEARAAGKALREAGLSFDAAFTSVLKRAIRTLCYILNEMDLLWIPVEKSWRLNERHYGALQGLNKAETAAAYGSDQVKLWRRSFDVRPPALARDDSRWPKADPRYRLLSESEVPLTESLKDTIARVVPYWEAEIRPVVDCGKQVIVSAHGNSLRALVKHLEKIGDEEIANLEIPTGSPLVYELDAGLQPVKKYYLAST